MLRREFNSDGAVLLHDLYLRFILSITSLFNLAFYPFLYNPSNGLFLTITGILVAGYVFKIVWNIVKNKNT